MKAYRFDLVVFFTQPPLAGAQGKEALDTALVSATFEQKTALVFTGSGVLQLLKNQQPDLLELKGIQAMLKALPLYDLDAIYVDQESMERLQLTSEQLLLDIDVLPADQIRQLMSTSKNLLVF
ncbi:tRNA 2-thiouridine synthesizing protein C [Marinospirillum celere]|uniref:tRNA 2-thiouridine synthesizing protein C n=1 Tax=Marinospirillum celere TaxID=1122252 RepID=A0A1I1G272_9GAMM|nr:sulfurtransferase complex subunit TusC [Marinospirillum celere]SFC05382.1 tRNA 2-thiouridine synthesizing protein C [Marinospirillum celere]